MRSLMIACGLLAAGPAGLAQEMIVVGPGAGESGSGVLAATSDRWFMTWTESFGPLCPQSSRARIGRVILGTGLFASDPWLPGGNCDGTSGSGEIAALPSGIALLIWRGDDADQGGILGRLFDITTGASPTGSFIVNQKQMGVQEYPDVAAVGTDRFAVVWQDTVPAQGTAVPYARIVMADGSMPGSDVRVPGPWIFLAGLARIAGGAGSRVGIAWKQTTTVESVQARVFDADLVPLDPQHQVNNRYVRGGFYPDIAGIPGGFLVAWEAQDKPQGGAPRDVWARYLDPIGSPVGYQIQVNEPTPENEWYVHVAGDASGRAVVTWTRLGSTLDTINVYGQRLDAQGGKLGPQFQLNGYLDEGQTQSAVAALPSGDFLMLWEADNIGNAPMVFGRRYAFPVSIVAGPGPGKANGADAGTFRPDGEPGIAAFPAYGTASYGSNVGAGDIDGAGPFELLTGPGPSPSFGPHVRAFQSDGTPLAKVSFYAYGTLRYGVRPQGGDMDGDTPAEILTAPGEGEVFGPHVRGFNYDGGSVAAISKLSFFAYRTLRYGARAVRSDVDGDGVGELLTGPGPGLIFGPEVRGFEYGGGPVTAMQAIHFDAFTTPGYGCTIGSADIESDGYGGYHDGYDEILVGKGPGPSLTPDIAIYDYDAAAIAPKQQVAAYQGSYGANIAGGDADAGDTGEIVTARGPSPFADSTITVWEWDPKIYYQQKSGGLHKLGPDEFIAYSGLAYGATIAVGTFQ